MRATPTAVLADLYHDGCSRAVPLSVALPALYAEMQAGNRFSFTLTDSYRELLTLVREQQPAIVGLSLSVRNWRLSRLAARQVRALAPHTLLVAGGPGVWRFTDDAARFTAEQPDIDVAIYGYGELPFAELLARWQEEPGAFGRARRERLAADADWGLLPGGCLYLHRDTPADLAGLPSPYLAGKLDRFLTPDYWQIFETNRGCPNACGYCTYSVEKQVREFPLSRIYAECDYVRQRCPAGMWIIADANFGLLERDLAIAQRLRTQLEGSGITLVYTNSCMQVERMNRLSQILAPVSSHTRFAVQSFEPEVLRHINRWVPSAEKIDEAIAFHHEHHLPIKIDLILGLPGSTRAGQLESLRRAFRHGFDFIEWFELWLLRGTLADSADYHRRFSYQVRYRARMVYAGEYDGQRVIEYEENPVACTTFSEEDYHYLRLVNWVRWFGFNYRFLGVPFALLRAAGADPVAFIEALLAPPEGVLARMLTTFLAESRAEWFADIAAAEHFYAADAAYRGYLTLNPKYLARLLHADGVRAAFMQQLARALRATLPAAVTDAEIAQTVALCDALWLTAADLAALLRGEALAPRQVTLRGLPARAAADLYRLPAAATLIMTLVCGEQQAAAIRRELTDAGYAADAERALVRCILATYDPHLMHNLLQRAVRQ